MCLINESFTRYECCKISLWLAHMWHDLPITLFDDCIARWSRGQYGEFAEGLSGASSSTAPLVALIVAPLVAPAMSLVVALTMTRYRRKCLRVITRISVPIPVRSHCPLHRLQWWRSPRTLQILLRKILRRR